MAGQTFIQKIQPQGKVTKTGTLLAILTGVASVAYIIVLLQWILPLAVGPGGRYPIILIPVSTFIFGALFYCCLSWVMAKLGFPATQPQVRQDDRK